MSESDKGPRVPGHPGSPEGYFIPMVPPYEEDEIDLFELWETLWEQRWLVLLFSLLFGGLAGAYAFLKTPVYRAEVVMVPVSGEDDSKALAGLSRQFGGIASLVGVDLGGSAAESTEVSIATLKSREFTNAFLRDRELLPVLFHEQWDPVRKAWDVDDPKDVPTEWKAFQFFDEQVRFVSQDKKTGIVTLAVEWQDPVLAAQWANELVERVNRYRQQEAIREAEKSIAYLQDQLRKTTVVEIQQAIYRLIEAQTKKIMLAHVRDQYAFKVVDPALPADLDDFVKPKRPLLIALGILGGGMLGVLLAFLRAAVRRRRAAAQAES